MSSHDRDRFYPAYHFRPDKNWMNDPNGLIFHNGLYHMFFQYNPGADVWGDIHWGHATSPDLIHWEEKKIALTPSYDFGEIHCYSGCCVEKENDVFAFYTSIGEGARGPETGAQQWSAISVDRDLSSFRKYGRPALGQEMNLPYQVTMWRDPFIWREETEWYMVLGGTLEKKGVVLLYSSSDLEHWKRISVFYESSEFSLIECPVVMKFGDLYLLLFSPLQAVRWVLGRKDKKTNRLIPLRNGIFDYSVGKKGFYAPNVYLNDPRERYIVFGCLFEGDRLESKQPRGWAGMQSLPRCVTLSETNSVMIRPADECRNLRKSVLSHMEYSGEAEDSMMTAKSASCEMRLVLQNPRGGRIHVRILASEENREYSKLIFDFEKGRITLNRSHSTLFPDVTHEKLEAPIREPKEDQKVEIEIFIDHSSIEIFYNCEGEDSVTMSARVFPTLEDSIHNSVKTIGAIGSCVGDIFELGF